MHTGPVEIRRTSWGLTVLCPLGHVVTARSDGPEMGGSYFLARVAEHQVKGNWIVKCMGAEG